eukprot:13437366-Ditylum_brightwellii.AAC.1
MLLLTVMIGTICVWLPNDKSIPWLRLGHTTNNNWVLSIPGVTEGEGRVVQSQRHKAQEIWYVAFGTSITWGKGVENVVTDTYPKLISPFAGNLAVHAAGPGLP